MKKLFSDYYQVDTKANRKIEGTGLGLSITKKFVELMDGEISVDSEYGKWTSFRIRIRQKVVSDKVLGAETVENLRSFRYTDKKVHISSKLVRVDMSYAKVLVVDDFQTNLDVAAGMMRKYKIQVDCVTGGQDAIDRIKLGVPVYNAVFMDHMMPGMDGLEATKRIRELDSEYARTVPIISLTANAITGSEQMFLDRGFQAFLSKPIDIMKLDSVLRTWIRDDAKGVVQIAGFDISKGLSLCGGDMELYVSILRSYVANTPEVIDKLRHVTKDDLPTFAINVHGLKGSSGNIGAESVREKARILEEAAKEGDLTLVMADKETLLEEATGLIAAIKEWLSKNATQDEKPCLSSPDITLLGQLRGYCEEFNMNGVDETMDKLEEACYDDGNDLVAWLREKVNTSDFNAICERIGV